jgi:methyl-accepting chemotaxis protein
MDESKGDQSQASIPETITQLNTTLEHLDRLILSQQSELEEIVTNFKRLSANLRELTANLKKYPGQLLLSSPPPKSEVMK